MRHTPLILKLSLVALALCLAPGPRGWAQQAVISATPAPAGSPVRWEKEIAAFKAQDQKQMPPKNGILFIGSSSIRKWTTLATDFPGLPVYNRGFGGSGVSDATYFADRIVFPYEPRLIVFYSGGNDIHAKMAPEKVAADFQAFAEKVHARLPDSKIDYISVSPNPARWAEIAEVRQVNQLVQAYCEKNAGYLTFLNFFPSMLGEDGQPLPDIFVADRLHMNEKGYALWTRLLRPHLASWDAR